VRWVWEGELSFVDGGASIVFDEINSRGISKWSSTARMETLQCPVFHLQISFEGVEEKAGEAQSGQGDDDDDDDDDLAGGLENPGFEGGGLEGTLWEMPKHCSQLQLRCSPYRLRPQELLSPQPCSPTDFKTVWPALLATCTWTVRLLRRDGGAAALAALQESAFALVHSASDEGTGAFRLAALGRTIFGELVGLTVAGFAPRDLDDSSLATARVEMRGPEETVTQLFGDPQHDLMKALTNGAMEHYERPIGRELTAVEGEQHEAIPRGNSSSDSSDWQARWLAIRNS